MLHIPGLFPFCFFHFWDCSFNFLFFYRRCKNFYVRVSLVCTSFCFAASVGTWSTSRKCSCHLSIIFPFSMSSLPSFDVMPLVLLLFFLQSCLVSWYTSSRLFFCSSVLALLLTSLSFALYSSLLISLILF